MYNDFLAYLATVVTPEKLQRMHEVLAYRTRHITVVLEDLFQDHNISATVRSAEIFGLQEIHVIENRNKYSMSAGIDRGASQWIDVTRHSNSIDAIKQLKDNGYTIVATVPDKHAATLATIPIDRKIALLMGTEYAGLSAQAMEHADMHITIPMFGFTESFNVSVCAALCMHTLVTRLHASSITWQLNTDEKERVLLSWMRCAIKHYAQHEKQYFDGKK